jgi:hypothetical protein
VAGRKHELPPILVGALDLERRSSIRRWRSSIRRPRDAGGRAEACGRRRQSGSVCGPNSPPQAQIRQCTFFPRQRRRARTARSELLRGAALLLPTLPPPSPAPPRPPHRACPTTTSDAQGEARDRYRTSSFARRERLYMGEFCGCASGCSGDSLN